MKAFALIIIPFVIFILVFTVVAGHIENIFYLGTEGAAKYFNFPSLIWPFEALRERGDISIAIAIAAGLAGWASMLFFDKIIYKKWGLVTKEQHQKIFQQNVPR